MKTTKKVFVGLKLDPNVAAWLKRAARNERVTISHVARRLIHAGYDRRNHKHFAGEAEA
jgi:hypothetical protein